MAAPDRRKHASVWGDDRRCLRAEAIRAMGVWLCDLETEELGFNINFWHWRAIVEIIRRLDVLDPSTVDGLHEQYVGTGLTREEARSVADAIEARVLGTLVEGERVKLDGTSTTTPENRILHRPGTATFSENFGTDREALSSFVEYLRTSNGFEVA